MNKLLTIVLMLVNFSFLSAQKKTITGTVSDQSGPLVGVNIVVEGTTNGTSTDFDGKYTIEAAKGDVLIFSYVGYKTKKIKIKKSNVINVKMKMGKTLDEVVVTGYTTTAKKRTATASTKISSKTVEVRPNSNLVQTLSGQTHGIDISTNSGQPGANSLVQLRGVNSINGSNNPLIIVDGVPVSEKNFRSLNQKNIKNVSVLKDTGATAIYGSRGANGVIVVKTKRGNHRFTQEIINNESYKEIEENQFEITKSSPLSTFSIDVDKASYSNIRRMINKGQKVRSNAVKN